MAIKNPTATQAGGVNQLIHIDTSRIYSALPEGTTLNTTIAVTHIGGATTGIEDPRYAGKALKPQQATGACADGAVVANTYLNRTGKTLASGDIVIAVAP
jgi:hypothetical protein